MAIRMVNRKRGVAIGLSIALLLTATACSSGGGTNAKARNSQKDNVNLQFETWQDTEDGIKVWWNDVIAAFEKAHPGDKVTIRHVESTNALQYVTTRFATGDPPDILQLPTEDFPVVANKGWLMPLDKQLAKTDILQNWPDAQSLMKWKSHTEGVMTFGYAVDLYYNKALLDAAGQQVPKTPEELLAVAKATTKDGVFGYGSVTKQARDLIRQASSYVVGYGGSWVKNGKYQFSNPKVQKALEMYRATAKYSPQGVESAQKRSLFLQGKVAMMLDGPFIIPSIATAPPNIAKNIKVARAPFKMVSYYPANGLSIASTISKKKKDLAWDFIRISSTPKFQNLFVKLYQSPAARAGAGANVKTSPLLAQFVKDSGKSVGIFPSSPDIRSNWGTFSQVLGDGLMKMLTTNASISDIFGNVQKQLDSKGIKP